MNVAQRLVRAKHQRNQLPEIPSRAHKLGDHERGVGGKAGGRYCGACHPPGKGAAAEEKVLHALAGPFREVQAYSEDDHEIEDNHQPVHQDKIHGSHFHAAAPLSRNIFVR